MNRGEKRFVLLVNENRKNIRVTSLFYEKETSLGVSVVESPYHTICVLSPFYGLLSEGIPIHATHRLSTDWRSPNKQNMIETLQVNQVMLQ